MGNNSIITLNKSRSATIDFIRSIMGNHEKKRNISVFLDKKLSYQCRAVIKITKQFTCEHPYAWSALQYSELQCRRYCSPYSWCSWNLKEQNINDCQPSFYFGMMAFCIFLTMPDSFPQNQYPLLSYISTNDIDIC